MARIRTIKPEFWEDEKIAELAMPCRLFFIGCWNYADDFGVIKSNATLLKSQIFPYDETLRVSELKKWIDALVNARFLIPISHKGESYYFIRTFRAHQILDKRYEKSYIGKEIANELINKVLQEYDQGTAKSQGQHVVNTTSTHSDHDVGRGIGRGVGRGVGKEGEELGGAGGIDGGHAASLPPSEILEIDDQNLKAAKIPLMGSTDPPVAAPPLAEPERPPTREAAESENAKNFKKFQSWIAKNAPQVAKFKEPFTQAEFERLKHDFTTAEIESLLKKMHNYKPLLTKNISANLTFRNWANIDKKRDNATTSRTSIPSTTNGYTVDLPD